MPRELPRKIIAKRVAGLWVTDHIGDLCRDTARGEQVDAVVGEAEPLALDVGGRKEAEILPVTHSLGEDVCDIQKEFGAWHDASERKGRGGIQGNLRRSCGRGNSPGASCSVSRNMQCSRCPTSPHPRHA